MFLWPVYAATHDSPPLQRPAVGQPGGLGAGDARPGAIAREQRGRRLRGGLISALSYHFTHLNHIQLQALLLPLSFFLQRMFLPLAVPTPSRSVVMGLQAISPCTTASSGRRHYLRGDRARARRAALRDWRLLGAGSAMAVALLVALPWSTYLRVARSGRRAKPVGSRTRQRLSRAPQAPPTNLLYGRTEWLRPGPGQWLPREDGPEQSLFPGFSVMLLAVCGAVAGWRASRKTVVVYAIVCGLGVVLSLGPDGIRWLYGGLYDLLPGMQAIRAPARFTVLALCAGAVLAALGVDAAQAICAQRRSRQGAPAGDLYRVCLWGRTVPRPPAMSSEAGPGWLHSQDRAPSSACPWV